MADLMSKFPKTFFGVELKAELHLQVKQLFFIVHLVQLNKTVKKTKTLLLNVHSSKTFDNAWLGI